MLFLLSCWIIAGIAAEDPPTRHYRMKNSSICFQVEKSPPYEVIRWLFNEQTVALNQKVAPKYTAKVDLNLSDYSLCVKKLTKTDSGTYKVKITDLDLNESGKIHRLSVQEAVSTPVIKMSVIRSNITAGFCNITVNCSIQDDWAWSVCDGDGCKTSQRSLGEVNITIYAQNRSVVCRGNNHVSTSNVSKSIDATCFNESNAEQEKKSKTSILMIIMITAVITAACVSLCIFMVYVAKRHCSTEHNNHQTSPAQLIQSQPVEAQPHPAPRASTSSSLSDAEAAYENVDATQPSQTSSLRGELESHQSQPVDTVYSFLQAANVTASAGNGDCSKDAKGHRKIHEASNSHSVTPDQVEQPAQIDTVYSVLQKVKTKEK